MPVASDWSGDSVGLVRPWRAGSSSPPLRPNTLVMAGGEMIGLHRALDRARDRHSEDHEAALGDAVRCHEMARAVNDPVLRCRALMNPQLAGGYASSGDPAATRTGAADR
jgi:hypothetical protein